LTILGASEQMIAFNAIAISNNVANISGNAAQIDINANAIQGMKS
jgi:hypothetical protein